MLPLAKIWTVVGGQCERIRKLAGAHSAVAGRGRGGGPPDGKALLAVQEKYGVEMDMASIPTLVERHGLVTGEPPTPETASSYQSGAKARHNPGLPPPGAGRR